MKQFPVLSLLFLFFLTALSTFEIEAQSPSKVARLASATLRLEGKTIKLKTDAYVNSMPQVIDPGNKQPAVDCSKSGRFIVPVNISVADDSALPAGIEISRVWVYQSDFRWKGVFNKDETNVNEKTIRTVARDCIQNVMRIDEKIKVIVALSYKGQTYYLRSAQQKLLAAN